MNYEVTIKSTLKIRVFALQKNPIQVSTVRYHFASKISFDLQKEEGHLGSL